MAACAISRKIRDYSTAKRNKDTDRTVEHTFSIALLVGSSLHTPSSLLSLRIDAIIRDTIFNAAKTRASIVTFLAGLLATSAGVLDLATLCTDKRLLVGGGEVVDEWVDMHRHL
jgi:hypothetical protein